MKARICTSLLALVFFGCGTNNPPATGITGVVTTDSAHGEVFGGQQPIVGMALQLYASGGVDYGSPATPLFASSMLTNGSGGFSFPAYSCPDAATQVYLVGVGGNPVAGGFGMNNPNLSMLVALGDCGNLNSTTHIHMNELTTIAGVWALAPFMGGGYLNVGTSPTNLGGLKIAFGGANKIVNTSTGSIPGALPAGAVLPVAELDTLADVLEGCINSFGGRAGDGSSCGTLFGLTANSGGTLFPTDTITAAMNIAQNPARNVQALFNLVEPKTAFLPDLGVAPTDWTVSITYTGFSAPTALAIDNSGNVSIANAGNDTVTQLDSLGNQKDVLSGNGLSSPSGLAFDTYGNLWVTNFKSSSLSIFNNSGTSVLGSPVTGNGLSAPVALAIDAPGNVWVANSGANVVSEFSSAGVAVGQLDAGGTSVAIAIDPK